MSYPTTEIPQCDCVGYYHAENCPNREVVAIMLAAHHADVAARVNEVVTEIVKGREAYSVLDESGTVVASAHMVHVSGTYSVIVRGVWRGAMTTHKAWEYLASLDLSAALDNSPTRALLGA